MKKLWATTQFVANANKAVWESPDGVAVAMSTDKARRERITLVSEPKVMWQEIVESHAATLRDRYPDAQAGDWLVMVSWTAEIEEQW
jgi:hypothetical protein